MDWLQWGDVAGWLAVVLALISAGWATVNSRIARKDASRAIEATERQAAAQERQMEAQERLVAIFDERLSAAQEGTAVDAPAVTFELEYVDGKAYVLRNMGTQEATDVRIEGLDSLIVRNLPDRVKLGPLQGYRFLVFRHMGSIEPTEIRVTARQMPQPQVLPWRG